MQQVIIDFGKSLGLLFLGFHLSHLLEDWFSFANIELYNFVFKRVLTYWYINEQVYDFFFRANWP